MSRASLEPWEQRDGFFVKMFLRCSISLLCNSQTFYLIRMHIYVCTHTPACNREVEDTDFLLFSVFSILRTPPQTVVDSL